MKKTILSLLIVLSLVGISTGEMTAKEWFKKYFEFIENNDIAGLMEFENQPDPIAIKAVEEGKKRFKELKMNEYAEE